MCVTAARAWLASTVLYAAEVDVGGEGVHVLGYQNKVANKTGPLARLMGKGSGNAMILPFPAEPGSMTRDNVLDTEDCPNILQDIKWAVEEMPRGHGGAASLGGAAAVQVFTTGIYTVVLARDARAIPKALGRVPAEKRPDLNPPLFDAYAIWYPDWTIALCCFNNRQAALASPMLWWYRPRDPQRLFAPALDCHTGAVPDLHAKVTVDHMVAFGSPELGENGKCVRYHDTIPPAVAPYLCERVIGGGFHKRMPNGDFVCRVADVRRGLFKPQRALPPAA
jgi:hypothetical protein